MFKWKVSGLGGGSSKKNNKANNSEKLNNATSNGEANNANNNPNNDEKDKNNKNKEQANNNSPKKEDAPQKNGGPFRLFQSSSNSNNNSQQNQQQAQQQQQQQQAPNQQQPQQPPQPAPPNGILKNSTAYDREAMSRVGQRLAMSNAPPPPQVTPNGSATPNSGSHNTTMDRLQMNLSHENIYHSSMNGGPQMQGMHSAHPSKPGWRPKGQQQTQDEEAIPSDSLYNGGQPPVAPHQAVNGSHPPIVNGTASWREKQFGGSRPSLNGMAHWSSHGYLAKANDNTTSYGSGSQSASKLPEGYVILRRQGDQMITVSGGPNAGGQQPQSLPAQRGGVQPQVGLIDDGTGERKYFSVKGYGDMNNKHGTIGRGGAPMANGSGEAVVADPKYYSVDARYHSMKNLPPDIRAKLRENLKQVHEAAAVNGGSTNPYQAPPPGSFQFAPAPPPRTTTQQRPPALPTSKPEGAMMEKSKSGSSVSWIEWTQQLQAYIAWVNSQLRKRPDLRPVQDLRTDLQSGEVLAQLIEIISGEKIAGIQYAPESLQGMRENVERILQFMASKRIKMHQITSKEVLEGNLKAVMRLILALAAHYKPQSVRHHDNSTFGRTAAATASATSGEPINKAPPAVEDSTLNQTQESILSNGDEANNTVIAASSVNNNVAGLSNGTGGGGVKRTPSLNESHYSRSSKSRLGPDPVPTQIYENFSSSKQPPQQQTRVIQTKATIEANPTNAGDAIKRGEVALQREGSFVMQREGSFVRTGSGRKLPKIPSTSKTAAASQSKDSTTLPPNSSLASLLKGNEAALLEAEDDKSENRKSKPKALEFWESLETVDRADFRYNTIHRMSIGRRMLPKAPGGGEEAAGNGSHPQRSHSLDREMIKNGGGSSLNSSFSNEDKLRNSETTSPKPNQSGSAQQGQPSPPVSSDSRGEVEGSSDNNSPPTSVIQGSNNVNGNPVVDDWKTNPAYDWIRGAFSGSGGSRSKMDEETLLAQLRQQRLGDGHSGSDSKHSDTTSENGGNIPYEVLLQDLTQAKRQLLELHNLLLSNLDAKSPPPPIPTNKSLADAEFAQCVENINVLNLKLKNADERCHLLKTDLRRFKQECATLEGSKAGLQSRLSEQENSSAQLKQELVRMTLAKQTLEYEKKELLRRVDDLERGLAGIKNENGEKDKVIRAHKLQIEEFARKQRDFNLAASAAGLTPSGDPDLKALYDEELAVAKDAISNLRMGFSEADPSQHILDTLEQCISVIIEKIQRLDNDKSSSRMSSLDYTRANEGNNSLTKSPQNTKILYFTNRSVTPFMSTINKTIGDITLRDFKVLFDRPGFYRYHFKAVDQEFGMVKEEIAGDEVVLPGADGKIVAWVEED